jgi:Zn-finger protein
MGYKKLISILSVIIIFVFSSINLADDPPKFKYVGVKSCGMCHKKAKDGEQLKIWEGSQHSKAYETLKTDKANKIAKENGLGKAVEAAECLKCHAPAHDVDASKLGKKFKIEQGVQCENCHGPGDKYKSKKVMKDQAKSVKNGLIVYADNAAIEKQCRTCHNEESPSYKEFVFTERWDKIKHNIPEKK